MSWTSTPIYRCEFCKKTLGQARKLLDSNIYQLMCEDCEDEARETIQEGDKS